MKDGQGSIQDQLEKQLEVEIDELETNGEIKPTVFGNALGN